MTATQTPCPAGTDRFTRCVEVPDPPLSPQGRKCYWDDTVQEAVGELRRRLASNREAVVTMALTTIMAVETTRMRHGRPVSGTQVSNVHEADDWDPLPKLAPLPSMKLKPKATPAPCSPGLPAGDEGVVESIPPVPEPITPTVAAKPTTPIVAGREAGATPPQPAPRPPVPTAAPTPAPFDFQVPTTEAGFEEIRRVEAEVRRDPAAAEERLRKTVVRGAYSPLPPSAKPPPKPESESGSPIPSPSG